MEEINKELIEEKIGSNMEAVIPEAGIITRIFSKKIILNDPFLSYPNLTVSGAEYYGNRSLVLPGKEVTVPNTDKSPHYSEGLIKYYKDNNIGAEKYNLVDVDSDASVLKTVLEDVTSFEELSNIGEVGLFAQSQETQDIFIKLAKRIGDSDKGLDENLRRIKIILGLPTLRSTDVGSSWEKNNKFMGGILNDEIMLRPYLEKYGFESLNMDFVIIDKDSIIEKEDEINSLLIKHNSAFIKFSGGASGDSIKKVSSYNDVIDFMSKNTNIKKFIVTEDISSIKTKNMTAQFYIDEKSEALFEGFTKQIVDRETGTIHQGNIVTTDENSNINNVDSNNFKILKDAISKIAGDSKGTQLGIDIFETNEKKLKIIEINGRMTGAIHPVALVDQLRLKNNDEFPIYAFSINSIYPRVEINNFDELKKVIGKDLLFNEKEFIDDHRGGVFPTLVDTLPDKLGVVIIADSQNGVEKIAKELSVRVKYDFISKADI